MRKLRVVLSTAGGALPAIVATLLVPATDGCGARSDLPEVSTEDASALVETGADSPMDDVPSIVLDSAPDTRADAMSLCSGSSTQTYIVMLPPPGVPATLGQICSVTMPPVTSNTAARVTLTGYAPNVETAVGFVAIPPALAAAVVGNPIVTVTQASSAAFAAMTVSNMRAANGGYSFDARWPPLPHSTGGGQMTVKTSFFVRCADGGTQTVEATTEIDFCVDGAAFEWVSSGDACTVCRIIAEMAPSPIVSSNRGDDLPLGRVLRTRVVEVARAGRCVLLFAENDAGDDAEYEWRVSSGRLEAIAADVALWTIADDDARPYGQVAVWSDTGAVVENFVWGVS